MKKKLYLVIFSLIILIGIILRFYNYENRWILSLDQAKDVIVARVSLRAGELPLLGSVSSAGFSFFGPFWYWFLMLTSLFSPFNFLAPWFFFTLLSVFLILVMILIGRKMIDDSFGAILGFITAISFSQVYFSSYLAHHILVALFTALSFLEMTLLYKNEGKKINYFLLGLFMGIGINIHWQALNLLPILFCFFVFNRKTIGRAYLTLTGLFISYIPLLIFDLNNRFLNFNNLTYYFLKGRHRFYMPNRWLTYIFEFWPNFFGRVIGLNQLFSWLIMGLIFFSIVYRLINKKMSLILWVLIISFLIQIILLRYHPGERFDTYLIYLQPIILILTALSFYDVFKINKSLGVLLMGTIFLLILNKDRELFRPINQFKDVIRIKNQLIKKYPKDQFTLYNLGGEAANLSLPLALTLDYDQKFSGKGRIIGICAKPEESCPNSVIMKERYQGFNLILVDLTKFKRSKDWYGFYPEVFKRPALKGGRIVNNQQLIY